MGLPDTLRGGAVETSLLERDWTQEIKISWSPKEKKNITTAAAY